MFSPASYDDWYFSDLLSVADDSEPENWVKVEPSMLYPCDKCADFYEVDNVEYPQQRRPAGFLNTETEEAWCLDCIEQHTWFRQQGEKDD